MTKCYPMSRTQVQMIQRHRDALEGIYTVILAGHDVTNGHVVDITDDALLVETPDAPLPVEGA